MKKAVLSSNAIFLILLLTVSVGLTGCANNSEDDLQIQCSTTDLAFQVVDVQNAGCTTPGSFTVEASGGTAPYQYSIDDVNFSSQGTFAGLSGGSFSITVMDAEGCTVTGDFTLQTDGASISLSLSPSNSGCLSMEGEITVAATGGTGVLSYSLDGSAAQSSEVFSGLSPGSYSVRVTDEEGCSAAATTQVLSNTSLENNILPIINADCAISGCHNGSVSPNLMTKAAVIGNAGRIKSETQSRSMPRERSLTQNEIDLIACWVDDGAKDN